MDDPAFQEVCLLQPRNSSEVVEVKAVHQQTSSVDVKLAEENPGSPAAL
jgi:hypothetical protein